VVETVFFREVGVFVGGDVLFQWRGTLSVGLTRARGAPGFEGHPALCPGRFPQPRDTIVYMSVYDEMPSPGAGLLRYARLKAGLSQSELGKRAGVARTMVSAYEHDRRQATLPTLMRLLKAAGFELHMQLAPYDDHDDVLRELEQHRSPEERQAWEDYQRARVAKDRAAVSAALRARKTTEVTV